MADGVSKPSLSRRCFFKAAATTVAGAGAAAMTGAGQALAAKVSKREARYRNHPNGNERCFVCKHYFVGHCSIVEGQVSAHGWCKFFAPSASAQY
jgi:hypothetical protein